MAPVSVRGASAPSYFLLHVHGGDGPLRQIRISTRTLYWIIGLTLLCLLGLAGLLTRYLNISLKAARYDEMRVSFDRLRNRYQHLEQEASQRSQELVSLQSLASEVSIAYGLNQATSTNAVRELTQDRPLVPSAKESIEQFNFLASAGDSEIYHRYPYQWQTNRLPSLWPVNGLLRSPFGSRLDPFSGEGVFHTGVDLSATVGTPVHVTADGVVKRVGWSGRYGKLIVVEHPTGFQTYYAHLSHFLVVSGQEVRRGQAVGLSGNTGRVSGPHLHYEVRIGDTPVNPYQFLAKSRHPLPGKMSYNDDFGL